MPITIPEHQAARGRSLGPMITKALPFLTSVAFHGALLGLGFLTYQSVKSIFQPQPQTIIPQTPMLIEQVLAENGEAGSDNPFRLSPTSKMNDGSHMESHSEPQIVTGAPSTLRTMALQEPVADLVITAGPGGAISNVGLRGGSGTAGLTPFGPGSGSGGLPNIFGPGVVRSAHSVAFLCDSSGSMLSKFDALRGELDKAIMTLRANQSFDTIFFGDNRSISLSPSLVMATPQNKVRATNFLEGVTPRGPTDPLPALELAFQQRPELIFVLTDGDFPDNDAVLKRIRELNRQKKVKINTIAFVGEGDNDTAFISLLKQIAAENGGIYKHVVQNELP